MATALIQQALLGDYARLSDEEADERIRRARARLGERVVILGHHYQRDEIIRFADYTGDSYKLCVQAASRPEADYIVFCGVHFMAESADVLGAEHQRVILPNLSAGCSMADMATRTQVEDLWDELRELTDARCVPITYMNSSAAIKSFCGEHGGAVCTSSNCEAIFRWALEQGDKIIFFPDEHLGRNTAMHMGFADEDLAVWDPRVAAEENDLEAIRRSRFVLWKGHCSVHQRFSVEQINRARREFPGISVIVHPECRREVVEASDGFGSTEYISRMVNSAPAGSQWAVGTEINLVSRLARQNPDKLVFCLDPIVCPCSTMYRIHPVYLCWVLENLLEGRVVNEIVVPESDIRWAREALQRMIEITSTASTA